MNSPKSLVLNRTLSQIGLAQRAGKIVAGDELAIALKQNRVCYLFIAQDASEKTKARFLKSASYKQIPVNQDYLSVELSQAIGKVNRMVLGLTDPGFMRLFKKKEEQYVTKEEDEPKT